MTRVSLHFSFAQRFRFPVERVFAWATDFEPGDIRRMGLEGRRRVRRLSPDTVVLTDTVRFASGTVTKKKLVRLFPERWSWTNTHLAGPNLHSQFLYTLVPTGRRSCRLEFVGSQIVPMEHPTRAAIAAATRRLAHEDASIWRHLADSLSAEEIGAPGNGR